jgi:hypothetical protein
VALFMMAMCVISVICVTAMKETNRLDLSELGKKYDQKPPAGDEDSTPHSDITSQQLKTTR